MLPESSSTNMRFGSTEVLEAVPNGTGDRSVVAAPAGVAPSAMAIASVANRDRAEKLGFITVLSINIQRASQGDRHHGLNVAHGIARALRAHGDAVIHP